MQTDSYSIGILIIQIIWLISLVREKQPGYSSNIVFKNQKCTHL